MGLDDKIGNKADELKGEAKERYGGATGDESMQAEGKLDKAKADIKQAARR